MNEFLENLKRQAADNPIVALGVGAGLITAISKLMDSNTHSRQTKIDAQNAKAWQVEVARRAAKDARKV